VIAATGDLLFTFGYTGRVFKRIVAPSKELLVVRVDRHLQFNECVELVLDPLADRSDSAAVPRRLSQAPSAAGGVAPRGRRWRGGHGHAGPARG
jgi:hypothetical protein